MVVNLGNAHLGGKDLGMILVPIDEFSIGLRGIIALVEEEKTLGGVCLNWGCIPTKALRAADFDDLYRDRVLHYIRESAVDAVCLLAQEAVYDTNGSLLKNRGSAFVPNSLVLKLANEHPEFLPAVSIHPARPDAMDELNRCLEDGAVMMKCLPNCQNIDCNNPSFKPFWDRMAEADLPFLAHTGGEHTLQVVRPEYADPRTLELPLECGVTVIAAHAASRSELRDPDYLPVLAKMFEEFPNLYADISALNLPFRSYALRECLKPEMAQHMVHGSDYPVPVDALWARMRGLIPKTKTRQWSQCPNPIERDYQLKLAIGFSKETFTRINRLLRLPQPVAI